jgi:hypothetical protein
MKLEFIFSFFLTAFAASAALGQSSQPTPSPTPSRPRTVSANPSPTPRVSPTPYYATPTPTATPAARVVITTNPTPIPTATATPTPKVIVVPNATFPGATPTPIFPPANNPVITQPTLTPTPIPLPYKTMSFNLLKEHITEAKRQMQMRPMPTAMTTSFLTTDIVRVAFYNWKINQLDYLVMTKSVFLSKDNLDFYVMSSSGRQMRVRTVRSNFTNTAISIYDDINQPQTPLVVQYPIEKGGTMTEMAYYVSSHPGLSTAEVINVGKYYVRNTIDAAREKLRLKGIYISPQIADIAERLSTVEHVDHQRFWNEYQPQLYNEIFSLYALNEGNTYRYSVSRAGAGGMVQMIPSTYQMMRNRYYIVGLIPDFVEGMRNHLNAAQAMLLYMQMTWNDLSANEAVLGAMANGTATQAELMAAGYNSNPARLPLYIRRGGANWKALIPSETKIYLQIYSSLERAVPMVPRTK